VANFPTGIRPSFGAPTPDLEVCREIYHEETRVMDGDIRQRRPHDRSLSHFDTIPACGGRADRRQTDRPMAFRLYSYTALCIVVTADAL